MGRRGPKPLPSNVRRLFGQTGGGRPVPKNEPIPPANRPEPPSWLNAIGRKEWDRISGVLYAIGTLTEIDQAMLAAYCMAFARYVQAERDLERAAKKDSATHGAVIATASGNEIQNPLMGVVNTLRRDMQRLGAEFGLSPSSRSQINMGTKGSDDPIARRYGL